MPFRLGLELLDDGHWRFWEQPGGGIFSFDFLPEATDETALSRKCDDLQHNPASSFVLNLVAQIRWRDRHKTLRGRMFQVIAADGTITRRTLQSAQELVDTLARDFHLDLPEAAALWPRIVARHEALFGVDA